MTIDSFRYPPFRVFYNYAPLWGMQRLKFIVRRTVFAKQVAEFVRSVNQDTDWQQFFIQYPSRCYPLLHVFADKRWSVTKRLQGMCHDWRWAKYYLGSGILTSLRKNHIVLAVLPNDMQICFGLNDICTDEGFWALSLRTPEGERLFNASFVWLENGDMLIASLQGPAGDMAKEIVYRLTKQSYGLRPQQLMVVALQYFADILGVKALLGMTQAHQAKLRWRLKKRVHVNYDTLWQEASATAGQQGYWHLPLPPVRKPLEAVESKKRSQYRKRYVLLDDIAAQMAANWQACQEKAV